MVSTITEAPRPQPNPSLSLVPPEPKESAVPQGLAATLLANARQMEVSVLVPVLSAHDLAQEFTARWPTYAALSSSTSYAMVAYLGIDKALALSAEALQYIKTVVREEFGHLDPQNLRGLHASLDTVGIVHEGITQFLDGGVTDIGEKGADYLVRTSSWLMSFWLCVHAVSHFENQPEASWRNNANVLCSWAFAYAQNAAVEWGMAELDLGLYSPLGDARK